MHFTMVKLKYISSLNRLPGGKRSEEGWVEVWEDPAPSSQRLPVSQYVNRSLVVGRRSGIHVGQLNSQQS